MKIALTKLEIRLLLALTAVLTAGCAVPSHASPVNYMLSPDVSGPLAGGVVYNISATFAWNTTTNLESNVSIVLTGSGSYAGTYTADPAFIVDVHSQVADNKDVCGEHGSDVVCLRFDDAVGSIVPDPLYGIFTGDDGGDLESPATGQITNATAAAVLANPAGVPEPSSIWLLATGLLGCIFVLQRRSQSGQRSF